MVWIQNSQVEFTYQDLSQSSGVIVSSEPRKILLGQVSDTGVPAEVLERCVEILECTKEGRPIERLGTKRTTTMDQIYKVKPTVKRGIYSNCLCSSVVKSSVKFSLRTD